MIHFLKILFVALVLCLTGIGCKKDNLTAPVDITTVPRTIGAFIENNYDLSLLHSALVKTGLIDSLKQAGAYTLFAPDNAAFNTIGIASTADLDKMNTDSLRFILKYHVIRDRYFISSFPAQLDNKYTTLTGQQLYVSIGKDGVSPGTEGKFVFVNGSMIMPEEKRNIALANGVIHIIRRPLNYTQGSVQDYISKDTSLTVFAILMKKFGYWDGLKTQKSVTVYAPSNQAFANYLITADSAAKINTAKYKPLAFGVYTLQMQPLHVFSTDGYALAGNSGILPGNALVTDSFSVLPSYQYNFFAKIDETAIWLKTQVGYSDWINNVTGPATVNYYNGYVFGADRLAENGIVHVVDQLFINPSLMLK